jgi:hypothetical protein
MDGVAALYCKSPSYTDGWVEFLQENKAHEAFASRLGYRRYDEIAIVMNEKRNDPVEMLFWGDVWIDMAKCARAVYDSFG